MNQIAPIKAYSVRSAAGLLDCKPTTLYKMIKKGQIKCFRIGQGTTNQGLRITAAELERFMRESQGTPEGNGRLDGAAKTSLPSTGEMALLKASMASASE